MTIGLVGARDDILCFEEQGSQCTRRDERVLAGRGGAGRAVEGGLRVFHALVVCIC